MGRVCGEMGISRVVVGDWMNRYPTFRRALAEIDAAALDEAEQKLIENARAGNQRAIEFLLTNRRPERYRPAGKDSDPQALPVTVTFVKQYQSLPGQTRDQTREQAEMAVDRAREGAREGAHNSYYVKLKGKKALQSEKPIPETAENGESDTIPDLEDDSTGQDPDPDA